MFLPPYDPILGGNQNFQIGHGNVQAGKNQCGPAAVANGLQWLEDVYGINVPHDNVPGLGVVPAGPDNSLVGQLDAKMMRTGVSRTNANGVSDGQFLSGKLHYIMCHNLPLSIKHMDDGAFAGDPGAGDFTAHGLTSTGHGGPPSFAFIKQQIDEGEAVELGWTNSNGSGHWVSVTGYKVVNGVPEITYVSDTVQSHLDVNDGTDNDEGTGGVCRSRLQDTDGDGKLNLVDEPGQPECDIVVAESPLPVYPGSFDDLQLGTSTFFGEDLTGMVGGNDIKIALPGELVTFGTFSLDETYAFEPYLVVGSLFDTGFAPQAPISFPVFWHDPADVFLLVNGLTPSPLGPSALILPGGNSMSFLVPPGLGGQSLMLQSLVVTPNSSNGILAITDGHEIRFSN